MRYALLTLFLLSLLLPARACDICGCGSSSYFMGIMPQFYRNFAGLRYQHRSYSASGSHAEETGFGHRDVFHRAEVWARYVPAPRWQLMAFLPWTYHQRFDARGRFQSLSGLGDATFIAHFQAINTLSDTLHKTKHSLLIGGGLKLPTGRSEYRGIETALRHPNIQPGTGSLDYLVRGVYTVRRGKLGLNNDLTWKYNRANAAGYRFGNRLTLASSLFWAQKLRRGRLMLMPNAGLLYESARSNRDQGERVMLTAGTSLSASAGVELYIKHLSAGFAWQAPLRQDLSGGEVRLEGQLMAHVTFML